MHNDHIDSIRTIKKLIIYLLLADLPESLSFKSLPFLVYELYHARIPSPSTINVHTI